MRQAIRKTDKPTSMSLEDLDGQISRLMTIIEGPVAQTIAKLSQKIIKKNSLNKRGIPVGGMSKKSFVTQREE